MASKYIKKFKVPEGFEDLLNDSRKKFFVTNQTTFWILEYGIFRV